MRAYWILSFFSVLMSMGLLMVILGQHREMSIISKKMEEFKIISEKVYNKLQYENNFKDSLQKLVTQGQMVMKDLETEVANLDPEVGKKKQEAETCQAEMKTKKKEVDSKESEHSKTTETLNAEAGSWNKEIDSLKAELNEIPKICDYVAADKETKKMCNKTTKTK